ncbi:fructosamine kinase family protein [Mangrovimonas sp. YM274]|uniref:fructosamine kinase family protein n=1 Tax=Mangrovimonas sp. YM274 TaxID=3070660 RepID=UPI0027DB3AC7|nr:fructosamine kinase family protein [Mangrovimonas sp. YM274]WMI69926.1 fructosamine kinase family protein [Mangrovimonas sp. YM274]
METNIITYLSEQLNESILDFQSISGGDISQAYLLRTRDNSYFLKANKSPKALDMFQKEALGLKDIAETNTISTPDVLHCNKLEDTSLLLMEYIPAKTPSSKNFKTLGKQLGNLHKVSSSSFGFVSDNYIGSLHQSNKPTNTWIEFYVNERLFPQLQLAILNQLLLESECPSKEQMTAKLAPFFQNVVPSLLHGDLWSGNYLISQEGTPYLIDPAPYYGHHEVDIAMSKLFGGFAPEFYKAYYKQHSETSHTQDRISIYQLYYLLVHLNLFGKSYYGSVSHLLEKYF